MTLFLALLLDAALGEPRWLWSRLPHPAVLMGRVIGWADDRFNRGAARRAKGAAACTTLCLGAGLLGAILSALPFGRPLEVIVVAVVIAQRSLVDHVRAVGDALRLSTGDGRQAVARIVGRDTSAMDDPAISRAAIESAAENFSDGVVAPILWFAFAGLPGILIYKIVNTADSMIGYQTPRHAEFGWASARLDDLMNRVPARVTALLIVVAQRAWNAWPVILRDARLHRSPNAGWPEAAMAAAIDVALAGPRSYGGEMRSFPFVNANGRHDPGPSDIDTAITVLWRGWVLLVALSLIGALF